MPVLSLRIPSADEIFQISRGAAVSEVQRQNDAWSGAPPAADSADPAADDSSTRPSLVLVPPDDEPDSTVYTDDAPAIDEPVSREQQILDRIADLEAADVPDQQSLIEIRDSELAELRRELADIRGEVYEPPVVDDTTDPADDAVDPLDDIMVDDADDDMADDEVADDGADDEMVLAPPSDVIDTRPAADEKPGIVDTILGLFKNIWVVLAAVGLGVLALLFWFMRRGDRDADAGERPWEGLDSGDEAAEDTSSTARMRAPTPEEAFVVVEQDTGVHATVDEETVESAALEEPQADDDTLGAGDETSSAEFRSLEDTFSSDTAVNLDQTDPMAEADFHMAYGLYDQAADLVNGALENDPDDEALMAKLCEIYFVWGNRDAFVDAAARLKAKVGDSDSAQWSNIVIMGQQIAADHELFSDVEMAAATKAVDLDFEADGDDAGSLDMDFGAGDTSDSGIVDLGAEDSGHEASRVDFLFEDEDGDEVADTGFDIDATADSPTIDSDVVEPTAEMPAPTSDTPTIEASLADIEGGTTELPSLEPDAGDEAAGPEADATAEINLDDLDLDISAEGESALDALDDLDATSSNEVLSDIEAETGKNPRVDPNETGVREGIDLSDLTDPADDTGLHLAADETGASPSLSSAEEHVETDVDIDESLLDATGLTQVLTEDQGVETGTMESLPDDAETLLASLDDDDDEDEGDDFDFAKTEALPPDAYSGAEADETGEAPAIGGTDVDLDLDDLTQALKGAEVGDTVEQPRDDETIEQPGPSDATAEVPTMELAPDALSDDLSEARTMTEVGTKLDLARAYVDMGDPGGARSILEEVLDEGDEAQRQQAQQLLDSLPS